MPLVLRPGLPADIPALVETARMAFSPPPHFWPLDAQVESWEERPTNIDTLFFTQDPWKGEYAAGIRGHFENKYRALMEGDGDERFMKVVETRNEKDEGEERERQEGRIEGARRGEGEGDGEEVIAAARWHFYLAGSKDEKEWVENGGKVQEDKRTYPEGFRAELMDEFQLGFRKVRREIMGARPYILLSSLATKPAHHRKGAGSLLLNWATERADGAGLPIYLESSAMGRPLYEKFGFETLQVIETDLEKYGGRGKDKRWLMLRRPQNNGIN